MINELQDHWNDTRVLPEENGRLVSLYTVANGLSAMTLLRNGHDGERFFWADPGNGIDTSLLAGIGVTAEVRVPPVIDLDETNCRPSGFRFEEVLKQAEYLFSGAIFGPADFAERRAIGATDRDHLARPRLFGGFAFQDDFVPDNTWTVFSPAHFILPHYQFASNGRESYVTINALIGPEEDLRETLEGLREALLTRIRTLKSASSTRPIDRPHLHYPMSPEVWGAIVSQATRTIRAGEMDKVVLSRVCEVRTGEPIDAAAALDLLNERYNDSYRFLFEPVPHHAFLGATPELLIRKSGDLAQTMALAGSIARGASPDEDESLAGALLASAKDRLEHKLVVEAIRQQLASDASELHIPNEPVIFRLRNIQHLLTPILARFDNESVGVLPLVRRLHPTPALGGVPAERALAFLRRVEPVPRGWYAAPIGWLDAHNDGAFVVAIRSAVVQHNRAWLYAGAGIVGDSEPDREWAETALKFRPMLGALGVQEAV